jgi:serine protease inhibitor
VSAEPASNTVISPLSIAGAFAMARVGARGETADQIDDVLCLPTDGVHAAFNAIIRARDRGSRPTVRHDVPGDQNTG